MKKLLLFLPVFTVSTAIFAQATGNYITGQRHYYGYDGGISPGTKNQVYLSDSSFVIHSKVVMSVLAESYVATFAIKANAKTMAEANTKVDERIESFIAGMVKMGINKSAMYVDVTTQTQILDYNITSSLAEQYIAGFEQKKNVIVKFKNISELERIRSIAAENNIYDLAKVDYVVNDRNKIYTQLFQTGMEIVNSKKDLYVKATGIRPKSTSAIYAEAFYSYEPGELYKSYMPDVSSYFQDQHVTGRRKDLNMGPTYFYDKLNYSGVDKVLNAEITEPAVTFVMELDIKFDVQKHKYK